MKRITTTAMQAIEDLAALPHRGSATQGEMDGLDIIARHLTAMGITARIQKFSSPTSAYLPAFLFAAAQIGASASYLMTGAPVIPLLVAGAGLLYILADSSLLFDIPITPRAGSANIYGEIPCTGDREQTIVIAAHVDAHRTPWLFSPAGLKVYRALMPVAIISTLLALAAYWIGFAWFAVPHMIVMLALAALMMQGHSSPYSPAVNDNASGCGVALGLAEHYKQRPLRHTNLVVLFTGCEEVGAYGARAFASKHKIRFPGAYWLSLDTLGAEGAHPVYLTKEQFLLPTRSNKYLVSLADKFAEMYGAQRAVLANAYTDSAPAALHGFKTISILAMQDQGLPGWHQPTDTHVSRETVEAAAEFAAALIDEIDGAIRHERKTQPSTK